MRILVAHNRYREAGGEDAVVAAEIELLRDAGHDVWTLLRDNRDAPSSRLASTPTAVWSRSANAAVRAMVREHSLDVVHVHNTWHVLSPAVLRAASAAGAAVVQTLHNYRLVCPGALLMRDGSPCEECVGRAAPMPALRHRCYRGSFAETTAVAVTTRLHFALGSYARHVDAFIALTAFARQRFVRGGLDPRLVHVRPNFVAAGSAAAAPASREGRLLFVGRLAAEKGIDDLVEAWGAGVDAATLEIVGDGPSAAAVRDAAREGRYGWLGSLAHDDVLTRMARASALVVPSRCYEGFPMVVAEAFAAGTPVIAPRLGALAEIVEHEVTGLLYEPGSAASLRTAMQRIASDPDLAARLGRGAAARHAEQLTPAAGLRSLEEVYRAALDHRARRGRAA